MTRLEKIYREKVAPQLRKEFDYQSPMQIPGLVKVSLNIGLGAASQNNKIMEEAVNELTAIAGQKATITKAKKSIAAFKVREGMSIGCRVTLRGSRMWDFLDKLFNFALPACATSGASRIAALTAGATSPWASRNIPSSLSWKPTGWITPRV